MNKVITLEQTMKTFLRTYQNAFALFQNPPEGYDMNIIANEQSQLLSQFAQEMQKTISDLKQIDTYTEEEIEEKTEKIYQERKIALSQYVHAKQEADKLNENLKSNIDNLANKIYSLNEQ